MNKPVWMPKNIEKTAMMHFLHEVEKKYGVNLPDYQALHAWSIENLAAFWEEITLFFKIDFKTPPTHILQHADDMLHAKWFDGATLNIAAHLLKHHDKHPALISINETGRREVFSYEALRDIVARCAKGLQNQGIKAGDRVAGMLPNNHFAIIAMLACASIGAIWSSCSPDFGVAAASDRLSQITPKLLITCDGYTYQGKRFVLEEKITALHKKLPSVETLIVCPFLEDNDALPPNALTWDALLAPEAEFNPIPQPFHHPWYILFSSGTTGAPKCIVHSTGGTLLQHFKELGLHTNLTAKDTLFFHTTCGWMMWNWMVSGLALGATLLLYDGSPMSPKPDALFELIDRERVSIFGTGARFLAAVEKKGVQPHAHLKLEALHTILSTGSPLLPQQYDFVEQSIKPGVQLSSISGGTDIVSCFALGNPIAPVYRGELQCLGLGMAVDVFNEQGEPLKDEIGELVCTKPFPSMPIRFWQDDNNQKYHHAYFKRFQNIWTHGDLAAITPRGGLVIYGRSDAVLNPGGVRIGTAEIYRPLEDFHDILESIVIGQPWEGDVRVVLFVKLKPGLTLTEDLQTKIKTAIRKQASPRHVPAKILSVPDIPRTINGKIVEVAARQAVQGEPIQNLGSLENPESLEHFKKHPALL